MECHLRSKKPRDTGSLKRRMLELLGLERAYVRSLGVPEEAGIRMDASLDYSRLRQIETALLEAERQRAKALMEMQRRRTCTF